MSGTSKGSKGEERGEEGGEERSEEGGVTALAAGLRPPVLLVPERRPPDAMPLLLEEDSSSLGESVRPVFVDVERRLGSTEERL
jgi:hypothetical protein